jgi:hypothetical protein
MLYPIETRGYAVKTEYIIMNIIRSVSALALYLLAAPFGHAALTPIGPLDFAASAPVLDFSALANNTEANGLIVDGVLFQVTKNGSPTSGIVVVDGGGPGTTGNISPPNLISNPFSDLDGVALIVSLPNFATQLGYGYAINAEVSIPAATTIDLFAGSTSIGNISFIGIPDPTFTGGFAGVASDTPFDRAVLTFSDVGNAFAVDNVTFAAANETSEEGQTLILLSAGVCVLLFLRARRREIQFSYR